MSVIDDIRERVSIRIDAAKEAAQRGVNDPYAESYFNGYTTALGQIIIDLNILQERDIRGSDPS